MEVEMRPPEAPAPQGKVPGPLSTRTVRISDVVKALEIAAERLGDVDRSCATLRAWAAIGRVTPAGQVLTPEAVAAGIDKWMAKKKAAADAEKPPAEKEKQGEKEAAADAEKPPVKKVKQREKEVERSKEDKEAPAERKPATPQTKRAVPATAAKQAAGRPDGDAAAKEATGTAAGAPAPPAKKARKLTYLESKEERLRSEEKIKELARGRLTEVLEEISVHMAEIVRRTSPEALDRWQCATASGISDAEQRELYTRLVHAAPDADVRAPEELRAELLPHQVEGLEWLASLYTNNLHGILADEMGLGKTIQTIALLLHIQERKGNVGPHLIVAPKSCLSNWKSEFERFAPSYDVHVLTGDQEEREAELAKLRQEISKGSPTALVTNYEQVYRNEWLTKNEWQLIVVDEGHRLKNPETVLHAAMKQLKCRMRLLLTGTPLQNGLNELWALLHYLLPELFTQLMDFKAWFSNPFKGLPGINEFEIQLDPEQEQQVILRMHALLSPFLLQRLKKDVLADRLPPRVEVTVRVPLSAWQRAAYGDLEQRTIRLLGDDNESVSSEQVNNALMQLRKIALHPYLFQESFEKDENLYRTSGKLEALDRLLAKLLRFGHKVLVFSQFTSVLDILEAFLEWRGIGQVRLDGQVAHEQRRERMERFREDPSVQVFLLSARAGSLGLNLQAADTVVLFDMDWNPQNDKQAVARVHRVGQTREVRVIRLLTDTPVERHMEQRCKEKLEMEQKIMGAGMFRRQATADQRKQALRAVLGLGAATGATASASEAAAPGGGSAAAAAAPGSGPAGSGSGGGDEAAAAALELTPPEEVSGLLARSSEEKEAFSAMDTEALRPRDGADAALPLLVQSGRLMGPDEVPAGFTGLRCDDD